MKTQNRLKKLALLVGTTAVIAPADASTDYGPAVWRPVCSGKWSSTGYGKKFYVVHDIEGYYLSGIAYMQRCDISVSVHYASSGKSDYSGDAPAGEISQLVRDTYYAWHARCWNNHSMGTEHEGFMNNPAWFTPQMYSASAALTKAKAEKYGFAKDRNHIVGHNAGESSAWRSYASANLGVDPSCNTHGDPGPYWDWTGYMALINGGGGGGGGTVAPSMFYDLGGGAMNIYRWVSSGSSFSTITQTGISSGYSLGSVGNHIASADVNADGKTDNVVAYQYPDNTMRLHVFLNGSNYQGDAGWFQSGSFALGNVGGRMVGGDFNGDGKGDVAMVYDNGGGFTIFRFLSTGSAFTYDSVVVSTAGYDLDQVGENVAASDVNGDGKTDLVAAYQYPDGTMRLHVFLNGNTYQGNTGWFQSGQFSMGNVAGRMVGGDFNGNGKGDIAMVYDNGGGLTIFRFLSTGSAFTYDSVVVSTAGYDLDEVGSRAGAGDINGDGKADIALAYQYPDGTMRLHTLLDGNTYQGNTGWYQSGSFNLGNVAGRLTMGKWQ